MNLINDIFRKKIFIYIASGLILLSTSLDIEAQSIFQNNDIQIIGFDNNIDPCNSKQLSLIINDPLLPHTDISLINSNYHQSNSTDWGSQDNLLGGIEMRYNGPDTIIVGDIICIFFICPDDDKTDPGGDGPLGSFQAIEVNLNGQNISNDWTFTNINQGLESDVFSITSNKDFFIVQGSFGEYYGTTTLNGSVIDYISFKMNDANTISIEEPGTDNDNGVIHIPGDGENTFGYVICSEDNCIEPGEGEPNGNTGIALFNQWIIQEGSFGQGEDGDPGPGEGDGGGIPNLVELCEELCGESPDCEEDINVAIRQTVICDFIACVATNNTANYLTDIVVNSNSIINDPLFDGSICMNIDCGTSSGSCNSNDLCAYSSFLPNQMATWMTQNGFAYSSCYMDNVIGAQECFYPNSYAFIIEDTDIEDIYMNSTNGYLEFYPYNGQCEVVLEVQVDCVIDSIIWSNGETGVTSISIPYNLETINTEIFVRVKCTNGCAKTVTTIITPPENAFTDQELSPRSHRLGKLNIYPNPSNNELNISLPISEEGGTLEIYNSSGEILTSKVIEKDQKSYNSDFQKHPSGLYLIVYKTIEKNYSSKFILN